MTNLDSVLKSRDITLPTNVYLVKAVVFHVWMWELDYKESWVPKNWCFWTVVSEKTLESPLDCRKIRAVHPKGDQSWVFIGRTDVDAETPILWPPDTKSWLIWKDPDAGKDWRQEEKGTTEDEMVGWHHRLNGYGFGWTLGVGDGQGGLACCGSWVAKSRTWLSDWTELNWGLSRKTQFLWSLWPENYTHSSNISTSLSSSLIPAQPWNHTSVACILILQVIFGSSYHEIAQVRK